MSLNMAEREGAGQRVLTREPPQARRQTWLDALRGVAVLFVLFEHLLDPLFPEVRTSVSPWFDFGQYGVMVFFLVSGYVVPPSLERRGSVSAFWIGRLFRLYPLWLVVALIGTVFGLVRVYTVLPDQLADHPIASALAHVSMMQDFLQVPSVVNVFWTLSYEMVFYLLVTAIFVFGAHRAITTGTLVVAMAGVLLGGLLPAGAVSRAFGGDLVILVVTVALVAGLAAILLGGGLLRQGGAFAVGVLAIVLLAVNSRIGAWQSLAILATMFAGTALYRLDQGQLRRGAAEWVIGLVPVVCVAAAAWYGPGWGMAREQAVAFRWSWCAAVVAAWVTFLAARRWRAYGMPRLLVRAGLVSYSLYLLHPLGVQALRRMVPDPAQVSHPVRAAWLAAFLAVVIGCSALSYRSIERPAQELGRRFSRARALR